jgi:hypothetical protein
MFGFSEDKPSRDSTRYYVEKSLLLQQALGEAENVKQTRELRERILPAATRSGKK